MYIVFSVIVVNDDFLKIESIAHYENTHIKKVSMKITFNLLSNQG